MIYPRGYLPSCMPLTFQGDKVAGAEEGTVLLKPKLMIARIRLASSSRTRGISLAIDIISIPCLCDPICENPT